MMFNIKLFLGVKTAPNLYTRLLEFFKKDKQSKIFHIRPTVLENVVIDSRGFLFDSILNDVLYEKYMEFK